MSQLQLFTFAEAFPLRIVDIDGNPWFIAADVCAALGLGDVSKSCSRLDDDEKLIRKIFASGQDREVLLVNESGLYNLILTSNKPQAKPFKKWVTSDVLPSIRKTGSYSKHLVPDDFESALRLAADQQKEIKRLALKVEIDAPKVAFAEAVETRGDEINLAKVGKHFNLPPNKFIDWMGEKGLIFKREQFGGRAPHWEPKGFMETSGFMVLRQEVCRDGMARPSTRVTGKGLAYISKLLKQKGFP